VEDLVLAVVAFVKRACKLEEDAPDLVLLHLFARPLVLADDRGEVSVLAKLHDDEDGGALAVDDPVLQRAQIQRSAVSGEEILG
jgi:hypothetical protein